MRILLVTNGLRYGGAERIVEALALGLLEAGDDVLVAATTRDGPIGVSLRQKGVDVRVLKIRSHIDLRPARTLASVAQTFQADIIHSHLAVSDIVTACASEIFGCRAKLVTTVHNKGVEHNLVKDALWRAALRRFDLVSAVSNDVASAISARGPVEILRPSLIDLEQPRMDRAIARRGLGVEGEAPVVLAIGRLETIKGFDILRAAAELVRARGVRFIVIGEGEARAALEGGRLELIGAKDEAAQLLAGSDLVVSPSRSEGFPQILIEAMAAEKPIIATAVGGTVELIDSERSGLLIPPEDPAALAGAIDRLLEEPERKVALAKAARAEIEARGLTKAATVDRARALYVQASSLRVL